MKTRMVKKLSTAASPCIFDFCRKVAKPLIGQMRVHPKAGTWVMATVVGSVTCSSADFL
jgi:hypothetical protein